MIAAFAILTFAGTFLLAALAVGIASFWLQRDAAPAAASESAGGPAPLLREEALSTISIWHELLTRFDFVDGLRTRLAQANLNWSVGRTTAMMLLLCSVGLALTMTRTWIPGWAAALIAIGCGSLPYGYVVLKRRKRLNRFEEQLPEALDFLANAMRAGHPLAAGLAALADERPAPLGEEMERTFHERKLGLPWEQALDHLARRIPLAEVRLFAAAIELQSRTGGNLAEVLGRLSESMRETVALRGEVRSLAAHGKLTGFVLTCLPFAVVGILLSVNPDYFAPLLNHKYGRDMIAVALGMLLLAHFVISKIVKVEL